jgi:hypothetical protein
VVDFNVFDFITQFPVCICPVLVEALQWVDPLYKKSYQMCEKFVVSEVNSEWKQTGGHNL